MRLGWRGVLGIILSVALLWWAMRDVSPAEVWHTLSRSNLLLFMLAAAVATLSFPLRAWRWRYILHGTVPNLPFGPLWRSTAIGMMVNNVVPARAGEFARAYALNREVRGVRFTAALASLVVDRVFDAIVILLLLVLAMAGSSFPRGTIVGGRPVESWAILFGGAAVVAMVGLSLLAFFPTWVLSLWDAVIGRVAPGLATRGRGLVEGFASGVTVLRDPGRFAIVFALTCVQWIINAFSFYLGFLAVQIEAPLSAAFFLQSLIALGVAVPSSPGFFGLFEAIAVAGLAVYGVDNASAVSLALGYHILSFLPITLFGVWYFARLGMHFRDLRTPQTANG